MKVTATRSVETPKSLESVEQLQQVAERWEAVTGSLAAAVGAWSKHSNDPKAAALAAQLQKAASTFDKAGNLLGKVKTAAKKRASQAAAAMKAAAAKVAGKGKPKVAKAKAKPKSAASSRKSYGVKSGDTLSEIAQNAGVSLKALLAANPQIKNPDLIYPGQKVKIPAGGRVPSSGGSSGGVSGGSGVGHQAPTGQVPGNTGIVSGAAVKDISVRGRKEMAALLARARSNAGGKRPQGWCLREVQDVLERGSYGKIGNGKLPRFPYARNVAEHLNAGKPPRWQQLGLKRLNITNPYDAPPGAIVVVRAGTPGTSHPTAGDIVIAGGNGKFYNDGEMGYGGRGNFPRGNNYVLGVYVPA